MLFNTYASDWLLKCAPSLKRSTYIAYEGALNRHLLPQFGKMPLRKLNGTQIGAFVTALRDGGNLATGDGLSPNSVALVFGVLKRMLRSAVKDKKLRYNPAEGISLSSGGKKVECFNEADQRAIEKYIVAKANPRLYGVLIVLYTGLRIGELLALKWENVDFRAHTLRIARTQSAVKLSDEEDGYFDTPKTQSGDRLVPFPALLMPYLKKLKAQGGEYVICGSCGKFVRIRSYQRTFALLLKKIKVAHKGVHALRHTFATRAAEDGADIKTLSEILGHSDPAITIRLYVHSSEKQKKRLSENVGMRLKRYET